MGMLLWKLLAYLSSKRYHVHINVNRNWVTWPAHWLSFTQQLQMQSIIPPLLILPFPLLILFSLSLFSLVSVCLCFSPFSFLNFGILILVNHFNALQDFIKSLEYPFPFLTIGRIYPFSQWFDFMSILFVYLKWPL